MRQRSEEWVKETCAANDDPKWVDDPYEVGRRHYRSGKNKTDGMKAKGHGPLRHLVALIAPITLTTKPFLEKRGKRAAQVEKMHAAWTKVVALPMALWGWPPIKKRDDEAEVSHPALTPLPKRRARQASGVRARARCAPTLTCAARPPGATP